MTETKIKKIQQNLAFDTILRQLNPLHILINYFISSVVILGARD